ncbi:MAG: hypothetical protein HQK53_16860 [Oligoflexia bacterium]|nr:hypothetical protein [Oligoflexia bacterium]
MLETLIKWHYDYLGAETPLHFSCFHPQYKMQNLPPTPAKTLIRARQMAKAHGLHYVYIGNLYTNDGENTYCPQCKQLLIEHYGYNITRNEVTHGDCSYCQYKVFGVWS